MRTLLPGTRVSVEAPATSANLGPGFDCFGLALDWRESVELEVTGSGVAVEVTGEGSDVLPRDASHLVVRCVTEGLDDLGFRAPGLALRSHNTIPHGRGLGSSSAAIVAGLVAARALAGLEEDAGWVLRHATRVEGHPDNVAAATYGGFVMAYGQGEHVAVVQGRVHPDNVAAATYGGFVMAYGQGEHVSVVQGRVHPDLRAAVVVPEAAVETRAARRLLPAVVPHADAAADAGRAALLVHAVAEDPQLLHAGTQDWLHQRYREPAMPEAYALMARLRASGFAAAISGAGPSVVVLGTEADLAGLELAEPGTRFRRLGIGRPAHVL